MNNRNLPNKLTMLRIVLTIIVVLLIGLPWGSFNIIWPMYLLGGKVVLKLNYLISAAIFVIAALTDSLDGYIARKYNMVTDLGKMLDAIADKILVNATLIVLAYNHDLSLIIPVIIISRDIIVDAIKMVSGNNGKVIAASISGKAKTLIMMSGITLVLIGNIPMEFFAIALDELLILIATCLSVYSGIEYYINNKEIILKGSKK